MAAGMYMLAPAKWLLNQINCWPAAKAKAGDTHAACRTHGCKDLSCPAEHLNQCVPDQLKHTHVKLEKPGKNTSSAGLQMPKPS